MRKTQGVSPLFYGLFIVLAAAVQVLGGYFIGARAARGAKDLLSLLQNWGGTGDLVPTAFKVLAVGVWGAFLLLLVFAFMRSWSKHPLRGALAAVGGAVVLFAATFFSLLLLLSRQRSEQIDWALFREIFALSLDDIMGILAVVLGVLSLLLIFACTIRLCDGLLTLRFRKLLGAGLGASIAVLVIWAQGQCYALLRTAELVAARKYFEVGSSIVVIIAVLIVFYLLKRRIRGSASTDVAKN